MIRPYYDKTTLDDALLRTYVDNNMVEEASQYVESVALTYEVTPDMIPEPVPYMVSRLALLFTYMTVAQRRSLFAKGGDVKNDSFALKYKLYRELLNDLLKQLTKDTFTNGKTAKKRSFPFTMPIKRS